MSAAATKSTAAAAAGSETAAKPAPPPFRFFKLLREVNGMMMALKEYPVFLVKYTLLQAVRLATALSFLVLAFVLADDFDADDITTGQYVAFACVGVLNVVGRLTPFCVKLITDNLKENLQASQATAVVRKIFELPHNAMVSTPTGEFIQLIQKVYRNLDQLAPAVYGAIIPVLSEVAVAVVFIGVAYGPIALIQLALIAVFTVGAYRGAKHKAERNRAMLTAMMSEWGKIMGAAESYERAHLFDNVDREVAQAGKSFHIMGRRIKAVFSGEHYEGMVMMALSLVFTVMFILVLPQAGDDLEGIEYAALAFYFVTFIGSLDQYAIGISNLRTALFEYQAFEDFLSRLSQVADVPDAVELPMTSKPRIEFSDVSFTYGGKSILNNVSFVVQGGETLGLTGASGCGKSTILRLLLRFYPVTSGTIMVDGVDITKVTARSLRRLFSSVTQNAQLFNGTVRENIEYGKQGSTTEEILTAAKQAELTLTEEGGENDLSLQKACGEKGAKLSGGQQQRVALARAILASGPVFLLDEPTTGLDGTTARNLQKTLDELSSGCTTVTITHHLKDLRAANSILYLENGRVVERGSFDELMGLQGRFHDQVMSRGDGGNDGGVGASAGAGAGASTGAGTGAGAAAEAVEPESESEAKSEV